MKFVDVRHPPFPRCINLKQGSDLVFPIWVSALALTCCSLAGKRATNAVASAWASLRLFVTACITRCLPWCLHKIIPGSSAAAAEPDSPRSSAAPPRDGSVSDVSPVASTMGFGAFLRGFSGKPDADDKGVLPQHVHG